MEAFAQKREERLAEATFRLVAVNIRKKEVARRENRRERVWHFELCSSFEVFY